MTAVLSLRGVSRAHDNGPERVWALHETDLAIMGGDFVVIRGPSGSGKSTLLGLMGLLDEPTTGEVVVAGESAARMSEDARAGVRGRVLGFVFQQFNLVPYLSVAKNVELPLTLWAGGKPADAAERVRQALDAVGMAALADRMPDQLSGGQQQRVAIARALVTDPRAILADEPTGNLDSRTGAQVIELLDDIRRRGTTVCLVTHDPRIAPEGHRAIDIEDGRIVSDRRA